jgi:tetratricopeptide (TPR) repeat protein
MRQIEQVGQMLAAIMGLAKGGRGDEALGMFDEAYKPLVGVGSRVVAVLDEGQLVDLLTSGSNPDMRRVAMALELLKAEADLYAGAGQPAEAALRWRRAVALAGCLAARSERLLDHELAADLLDRAGELELELSVAQRVAVARVLEALGRYADAEDALFELIDERPDDPRPVEEAIAFCQRLRPLEPEQLAAGGLTLEEVNDTLAELLRRQPVPDRGVDDGSDDLPFTW